MNISSLEDKLHYHFKDRELLLTAMTHSSYYNENKDLRPCNERLEFLGDAILGYISAEFLYKNSKGDEGDLSRTRSVLVCEDALFEYATSINLGNYLLLGKGDEETGRNRKSTIADAMEATLCAIYLDAGIEAAKNFILPFIERKYRDSSHMFHDYKTILQEVIQKNKGEKLSYTIIEEKGPDHNKTFVCQLNINSNVFAHGEGSSKKNAEQQAARQALELMGIKL